MSSPLDNLLDQIVEGKVPERVRQAAARGALPLAPVKLIPIFLHLSQDENESIRQDAASSLAAVEAETLSEVLGDADCPPSALIHFAGVGAKDPALAEKIAFNPSVPDDALAVLGATGNGSVIDLVLTNQERLLASPLLLERVMANPALSQEQRGRILEILERIASADEKRKAREAQAAAGEEQDDDLDDEDSGFEEAARLLEVDVGELLSASEIVDGDEFEKSEDDQIRSAYKRIIRMNTAQKAVLAMKGDREERSILIRDTNKTVSMGVLKNGRITEAEVEGISKMRNVSGEILRQIGTNRDWSKNYTVTLSLVQNPRTPPAVSTNFINRLQTRHLKQLGSSKDIPELIRRMARKAVTIRTQKSQTNYRKK